MRRYAYYLLIVAAAAIAACQVEPVNSSDPIIPDTPELQADTYIYTINASIPEESTPDQIAVKSNYDADGHFSWSSGDAISVLFHDDSKEDSDPEKNKFFTLTLTSGAGNKSASFSGAITAGYTIGASDGTVSDKKIWALFPASTNHSYTPGSNPSFYVQPSVDFSATYFSANVPMYALNTEEGALAFANLASTYKFIVNGIKDGVSKVGFTVYNQTTYGLSGSWPIHNDKYINYNYASPGSANSTLSYVGDVTSNQAAFYVSCRYWGAFQPVVTVTNYATGAAIKTFTATKADTLKSLTIIQPVTLDVSEAAGGNYFVPAVFIDGVFTDWDGVTEYDGTRNNGGSNSRINGWRMKADAQNIYVYLDLVSEKITESRYIYVGFDTDSDTSTGSTRGGCPGCEQYVVIYPAISGSSPVAMIQGVDPRSTVNGSSDGTLETWCNLSTPNSLLELCIPRSKVGLTATASIKVSASYNDYDAAQQTLDLP